MKNAGKWSLELVFHGQDGAEPLPNLRPARDSTWSQTVGCEVYLADPAGPGARQRLGVSDGESGLAAGLDASFGFIRLVSVASRYCFREGFVMISVRLFYSLI